jgi:hypothetical protein
VSTEPDLEVGSRIALELGTDAGSIDIVGCVRRVRRAEQAPPEEPAAGVGMGFDPFAEPARAALSGLLAAALSEFRL